MTRTRGGPPGCLACLVLALAVPCALAADAPVYRMRLELPISGDPIDYPRAVTADLESGEIIVCDTRKNRLLIFDDEGLFRYEIEGGSTFSAPTDLAVDRDGFLFVLANHQRRRTLLELDFDGLFRREIVLDGLPAESLEPSLASVAVTPDGERLFLVDDTNLTLIFADRDGRVERVLDLAPGLSEERRQDLILGKLDVYGDRLVLAVPSQGEIRVFDLEGSAPRRVGLKGTGSCQLAFPTSAALDADGNLVVVDQQRMFILRWSLLENRCLGEYYGLGGAPGYLYFPVDTTLDAAGRIYVTQGYQGRVQVYQGPAAAPALPPAPPEAPRREIPEAPAARRVSPAADPTAAVERVLRRWAHARAERLVEDYLAAYSDAFIPGDAGGREAWAISVPGRLEREPWVEIEISELAVEPVRRGIVRVKLLETLRSAEDQASQRKTMLLRRESGVWKIIEERVERRP